MVHCHLDIVVKKNIRATKKVAKKFFLNRSEFHQHNLKGPKQKYNKIGIVKRVSTTLF
jgi:hypothetical protein